MEDDSQRPPTVRRPPPPWRRVEVAAVEELSPRLAQITLAGPELAGFPVPDPAASVRLLLPAGRELVIPTWTGNEFLLPGGERPSIRTFTPLRYRPDEVRLDVEIVLHPGGVAAEWAASAAQGDQAAVSGPGRGYTVGYDATGHHLFGDETALPAIRQLLEVVPPPVEAHIEVVDPRARLELPAAVVWHELPPGAPPGETLLAAVTEAAFEPGSRVWAAGEAAGMQRIRRHLFEDRNMSRADAVVRGYWKKRRPHSPQ